MLSLVTDADEPTKKKAKQQVRALIVDGERYCRQCHGPVEGRQVFCENWTPRCKQAYHRQLAQEKIEQLAFQACRKAVEEEAASAAAQLPMAVAEPLLLGNVPAEDEEEEEEVAHARAPSTGWDADQSFREQFNSVLLGREVDGWQQTTLTAPIDCTDMEELLVPFVAVTKLPRGNVKPNYVMVRSSTGTITEELEPWSARDRGTHGRKLKLSGFDRYDATQHAGRAKDLDEQQRTHVVSFLPWLAWAPTFPDYVFPSAKFASSGEWAMAFEQQLLARVAKILAKRNVAFDSSWEVLYVHVLQQSNGASRFRWHVDTEEDTNMPGRGYRMRVHISVVLLLEKDALPVPGLFVAGAPRMATYTKEMWGHIFDARLWHTTEEKGDGECGGKKLGVFIGRRF